MPEFKMLRSSSSKTDSPQVVGTPRNFLDAVEERWGKLEWDLATNGENSVAPNFITEEQDSLSPNTPWPRGPLCWINPPYRDIRPWVQKAYLQSCAGSRIIMLLPCSVDSVWFDLFCYGKALTIPLADRPKFDGYENAAAAPHMVLTYGLDELEQAIVRPWRWK